VSFRGCSPALRVVGAREPRVLRAPHGKNPELLIHVPGLPALRIQRVAAKPAFLCSVKGVLVPPMRRDSEAPMLHSIHVTWSPKEKLSTSLIKK
jgi:hypothetical protein